MMAMIDPSAWLPQRSLQQYQAALRGLRAGRRPGECIGGALGCVQDGPNGPGPHRIHRDGLGRRIVRAPA